MKQNSSNKQLCFSICGIHQLLNNESANPIFKTAGNISNFSIFDIPHGTVNIRWNKTVQTNNSVFLSLAPTNYWTTKLPTLFSKTGGSMLFNCRVSYFCFDFGARSFPSRALPAILLSQAALVASHWEICTSNGVLIQTGNWISSPPSSGMANHEWNLSPFSTQSAFCHVCL